MPLSNRHRATWDAIFAKPVRANIHWRDVEALLVALGARIDEGAGSRVAIGLNGMRAVFHRPHPHKEIDRGAVRDLREFLEEAGVGP